MNTTQLTTRRVESLDAFRGITSILIMLTHFILYVPEIFRVENLGYIYNGLSWKLPYFFILSGYVLTISYQKLKARETHPYATYLKNRVLRIYPLFFVTTLAMFAIRLAFGAGADIEGASPFFNITWRLDGSITELLHSLTLIGEANTWTFNGPAWTLVFEMRYSIILPLLILTLRWRWWLIAIFIALSALGDHIASSLARVDLFYALDYHTSNFCSMLNFLLPYTAGIALALNRERLFSHYLSLSQVGRWSYFITLLALVINPIWGGSFIHAGLSGVMIIVGVIMWIVVLINNHAVAKIFSTPMMVAIGRSSFSIYLWHTPIFITLYMSLRNVVSIWYIIPLAAVTTLVVAHYSFKFIESRFIALSKRKR